MAGIIHKHKKKNGYVQVDNHILHDTLTSWKAKGLLVYLIGLPEDWSINLKDLTNRSTDGRDGTASAMNELIRAGYVIRERVTFRGKFEGYDYHVFERPEFAENWKTENGKSVNGLSEYGKTENGKSVTTKTYSRKTQRTKDTSDESENEFSPTTDDDAAQYFTVETHEPPKREVVRLDAKNATTSNGARRENFAALARNGGRVEDDEFGDFMAKEYGVKIVTVKTAEPIPETLGKSRKAKRQIGKPEPFEETKQAFCHFSNPDKIAALWSRWLEYKKEQHGERYKTEDSEKTQLRALWKMANGNADQAEKIIEQSIGNLWKGLFQLKTENENGRPKPVNKVLAQQDELARGLVEYYAHKRFATVE